jgi:hypothetical protein
MNITDYALIALVCLTFVGLCANCAYQWQRMERLTKVYNLGFSEGFAGRPPMVLGSYYSDAEVNEYLRGRSDGWRSRKQIVAAHREEELVDVA